MARRWPRGTPAGSGGSRRRCPPSRRRRARAPRPMPGWSGAAVAATIAPRPCPAMIAGGPPTSTPAPFAASTVSASQASDSRSRPVRAASDRPWPRMSRRQHPQPRREPAGDRRPAPGRGGDAVEQEQVSALAWSARPSRGSGAARRCPSGPPSTPAGRRCPARDGSRSGGWGGSAGAIGPRIGSDAHPSSWRPRAPSSRASCPARPRPAPGSFERQVQAALDSLPPGHREAAGDGRRRGRGPADTGAGSRRGGRRRRLAVRPLRGHAAHRVGRGPGPLPQRHHALPDPAPGGLPRSRRAVVGDRAHGRPRARPSRRHRRRAAASSSATTEATTPAASAAGRGRRCRPTR